MPVVSSWSFTLEIPDLEAGIRFYTDAGLIAAHDGIVATLSCKGQHREAITLLGGHSKKRLHHITLRAENLPEIATLVPQHGGAIVPAPAGFAAEGLWLTDPHGMLIHLIERPSDPQLAPVTRFEINQPGHLGRIRRSAILPASSYPPATPLRLGHVLVFTPDVPASTAFMVGALGMGLADQAQDIIAFCCARKNSDHHVVAFAKSAGIGFHHGSFQLPDPDAVGRGGVALLAKTQKGDWGFGRHTIGSNFFHYIQDPWGSWFEYYSDMDFIDDHALWTATNYEMRDSLASWGPAVPHDFVHNYELDAVEGPIT
jgi:catechol 2,3-dioxygenase-like lactoylglutathione lyase family enzyme